MNKRKRLTYRATLLTCMIGCWSAAAMASDLGDPVDRNPTAQASAWRGPYAGLTLGAVGTKTEIDRGAGFSDFEEDTNGATPGIVLGYSWVVRDYGAQGRWLLGLELDASALGESENKTDSVLGSVELDGSFIGSARARAGYAWERFFLYGTAGVAFTDINVTGSGDDDDALRTGLALGLGGELKFDDKWSGRLEAIAYGFDSDSVEFAGTKRDVDLSASTIRIGITRRF